MYGWGEARLGQLGLDKHREVRVPTQIRFPKNDDGSNVAIKSCSAGFGHTAALTNRGELYTWGFNIYGQAGLGDKKTHWYPEQVTHDGEGN